MISDEQKLEQFVSCFMDDEESVVIKHLTDPSKLAEIYAHLPGKFPPLFEKLLLSYRWSSVSLYDVFRLLNNTDDEPNLSGFLGAIFNDEYLVHPLLDNGYIQFGFDFDFYDPVCFNLNEKSNSGDFEIVMLDHELILQFAKIKKIKTLAPSFEALISVRYSQP